MSHALNQAGLPIDREGNETVSGGDQNWNYYRVKSLEPFIEEQFGPPTLEETMSSPLSGPPTSFEGKTGVVSFEVDQWSDATGHITLWDGEKCINEGPGRRDCYWEESSSVKLWELK